LTWVLRQNAHRLGGFDLHIESDVPLGSGLSSSAALLIAALRAFRQAFALPLDDVQLAQLAQRAEVDFVGAPVGIMDQMACSLADERAALFLDTRSLNFERVPLPPRLELVVIDSGVRHQHTGGGYRTRRAESEEAARLLGVTRLRDAPPEALDRLDSLPPLLARRARHVLTENARVLEAREAMLAGDLERLGRLFAASHASLRDDYEVSVPEVDLLVAVASRQAGVFGARMTGGGFGGAVVIAAAAGTSMRIGEAVASEFAACIGRPATVLVPVPSP
jgi:galactokinase